MTLEELLADYIAKRLRRGSPNTVRLYNHSIRSFRATLGHEPTMEDLTDESIERHLWRIVNAGGSPASANKDHGQLTALWRFASHNRMVETWPNVRTIPEVERIPMGWLPHEAQAIFAAAKLEPGAIATVKASLWCECLLRILFETGERIKPIREIARTALQGDWLLVPAHLRKHGLRDKLYPLEQETLALVRELIASNKSDDKRLFPWDRCETYIYNRYKVILQRAKLPDDSRSKFHRIRRTVASAVARSGGDATAAMDHASPRTTKKYLDPRIVGEVSPSEIMKEFLRNPTMPEKRKKA